MSHIPTCLADCRFLLDVNTKLLEKAFLFHHLCSACTSGGVCDAFMAKCRGLLGVWARLFWWQTEGFYVLWRALHDAEAAALRR